MTEMRGHKHSIKIMQICMVHKLQVTTILYSGYVGKVEENTQKQMKPRYYVSQLMACIYSQKLMQIHWQVD